MSNGCSEGYAGYDGSVLYFASIGIFLLAFLYKGSWRIVLVILNVVIYVAAILLQANVPGLVVPMAIPEARVPLGTSKVTRY